MEKISSVLSLSSVPPVSDVVAIPYLGNGRAFDVPSDDVSLTSFVPVVFVIEESTI